MRYTFNSEISNIKAQAIVLCFLKSVAKYSQW